MSSCIYCTFLVFIQWARSQFHNSRPGIGQWLLVCLFLFNKSTTIFHDPCCYRPWKWRQYVQNASGVTSRRWVVSLQNFEHFAKVRLWYGKMNCVNAQFNKGCFDNRSLGFGHTWISLQWFPWMTAKQYLPSAHLPNAKATYIESGVYYCLKHLQRSSFEFVVNVYEELWTHT